MIAADIGTTADLLLPITVGKCYLRINFVDYTAGTHYVDISHPHLYDSYSWNSLTTHKSYCDCGIYKTDPHVVLPGSPTIGRFAQCIVCNGNASVGNALHQSINELPHTENGSYILPNGVIVLVEADVEAYFNGTLIFYNKDDLPQTE